MRPPLPVCNLMPNKNPLLSLGFRPFFLAAGAIGCLSLLAWLATLHGLLPINLRFVGSAWHAHEMLYGYTLAVIAGFLLTAVRNRAFQEDAASCPARAPRIFRGAL